MGSQNGGESRERTAAEKHSAAAAVKVERTFVLDENGESKELHPCKYCKKMFGTHTNMRRHQRRIHERHLLPKGVHRKGMLLQETQPQKQPSPPALEVSPNSSSPPIYVPSGDAEDEGDQEEEYMVDISSNISENLSLYIDGKILSTSAVSTCEVIEVDSGSAALFGLDAVIIRPDQLSHALKVETTTTCVVKEIPSQSTTKRRTTTPPLPPKIKTELESEPIMPSLTSSSSSSSSSSSLVGSLFPQPIETLAFQKEKNVYLSPKLKQLLQTQESHKPTVALITDGHRLGPPLSVTTLPAGSGRFKRRTASPPTSPQHSPVMKVEGLKSEVGVPFALKVPKLESHCSSPAWSMSSKDERDTMSPPGVDALKVSAVDWPASRSGGSSCNQQPLDLSNAVSKRSDGFIKGPGEVVLDLSMHRKPSTELEAKGGLAPQPLVKKKKPNTSMLEKVLMNEYAGLDMAGDEGQGMSSSPGTPSALETAPVTGPDAHSISPEELSSESPPSAQLHPPPSLTPVLMHPPSPCTSALGSPTPPPPVLPTAPSPLQLSMSSEPQPVCSPAESPLPVLSPKPPPRSIETYEEEAPASSELDSNASVQDENSDSGNVDSNVPSPSLVPNDYTLFPDPSVSHAALQACAVESLTGSEDQLSSASVTPSESSIDPLSIAHGSVVIECTVSVGSSESNVSAPLTVQENPLVVSTVGDVVILEQALTSVQHQPVSPPPPQSLEPPVLVASLPEPSASMRSTAVISENPPSLVLSPPTVLPSIVKEEPQHKEEPTNTEVSSARAWSSSGYHQQNYR
ncbi:hypothetical protein AAFF_G00125170 [Aldrovandia affinis]|uniref:C2H2-type domain-containing protein n=1 Tax=Aldrovandia affinis TaxID=143900 RepID=A0AAD7RTZ8_9TELE|nr:hypothetical protein AAFF_G00125170 [Aldrovandia affinis]